MKQVESVSAPKRVVTVVDAIGITIGIVVGAGIFSLPSLVAGNAQSEWTVLLAWTLGGAASFIGALVYAELATTFPHAGGDYHFLRRAFGSRIGFLFAWARMSVIQTGSMALLAFVFGDYASRIAPLGAYSSSIYAAGLLVLLTGLNILGVRQGTGTQNVLTTVEVLGVILVIAAGFTAAVPQSAATSPNAGGSSAFGMMMVFVLLTYGGWNEAAYLSAELRDVQRNMTRALFSSILVITVLYVLINLAYLRALGLAGVAGSNQVAADVMRNAFGEGAAGLISVFVAISALTSANATIFTGARTSYALGCDVAPLSFLGRWSSRTSTPVNALLAQGAIGLGLVLLGTLTRENLETIVNYTSPVFWSFFLLTGISLFVLRRKDPGAVRPFRVPLYPLTPIVFCATCTYLLYSSLNTFKTGALVGVAVVAVGVLLSLWLQPQSSFNKREGESQHAKP